MAKYSLISLNSVTSGDKQKIINIDVQLSGKAYRNSIYATDTEELPQTVGGGFNRHSLFDLNNNTIIHSLFDIKDVCVKSQIEKGANYGNNIQKFRNKKVDPDIFVDIYAPPISSNPIGIVQMGEYSYIMTDGTDRSPEYQATDIVDTRLDSTKYMENCDYSMKICGGSANTYIYGSNVKKVDDDLIDMFKPRYCLDGIKYNYILEIPQCEYYYNNLDTGNVVGDVIAGKNAYNNDYSMEMSSLTDVLNCRDYCGIGKCSDKVFLKYYDNLKYVGSIRDYQEEDITMIDMEKQHMNELCAYPFQKVEVLDSINRFKRNVQHKSGIYSIDLYNTGLAENEFTSEISSKCNKIINDIKNNIREITRKICPVNTQLFDVYFKGE